MRWVPLLSHPSRSAATPALLLALLGCSGGSSAAPDAGPDASTLATWQLSFPGARAGQPATFTFTQEGDARVRTLGGLELLTPPAGPLVMVAVDPGASDQFHDTEASTDADFVAPGPYTLVDQSPNALHVRAAIPGGGTLDLTFSASPASAPASLQIDATTTGAPVSMIAIRWAAEDGAAYVGFGEHFAHVNARGQVVPLAFRIGGNLESGTNEHHVPIPVFTSSKGWGMTVATYEAGAADMAGSDPSTLRLVFEGGQLHAKLVAVDDPIAAVEALTQINGVPRRAPNWALAPFQWRNETTGSAQVLDDATTTRALGIPGGCIWVDNPWQQSYNDFTFMADRFPDPAGLAKSLAALGFASMVWSTPYLESTKGAATDEAQRRYLDAKSKGFLVTDTSGVVWQTPISPSGSPKGLAVVDLLSDGARAWWASKVNALVEQGYAGFKLDYGEDFVPDLFGARPALVVGGKPDRELRGKYALAYHQAYRDGLGDDSKHTFAGFILGRASALGGQTIVDAIWPGDLDIDFGPNTSKRVGGLAASVVAIQTLAASGFPMYGADTGGYRGTPSKEQLLRWAEHTAYSVMMQNGGEGVTHNPWAYDLETVTLYRGLARAHMDLVPYLQNLLDRASHSGTPTVRALPLADPTNVARMGAHADDEYLLGPDILVAPTMQAGATAREVYVPPGTWVRRTSGAIVTGPALITLPAPLGDPVVLVRAGAVIPMLADDVDTLGTATDPSVVTAAMRASKMRAHVVAAGAETARFPDGSSVTLASSGGGVSIGFASTAAAATLDLIVDVATTKVASWIVRGAPVATASDAASTAACTTPCAFSAGSRWWIHLPAPTTLTSR